MSRFSEQAIHPPREEVFEIPPEEREGIERFLQIYIDTIQTPETPFERNQSYNALALGRELNSSSVNTDAFLEKVFAIFHDDTQPTLADLAAIDALGNLMHQQGCRAGDEPYYTLWQEMYSKIKRLTTTPHTLLYASQQTDLRKIISTSQLYNAQGRKPPALGQATSTDEATVIKLLNIGCDILKKSPLEVRLARIEQITNTEQEQYEIREGFPSAPMILATGYYPSETKIADACRIGMPRNKRERLFDDRLPAGLICIETTKRPFHHQDNRVQAHSNYLYYIRIPAITEPSMDLKKIKGQEENLTDETLIRHKVGGSLPHYLAIRVLRSAQNTVTSFNTQRPRERRSSLYTKYCNDGIQPLIDHYTDTWIRKAMENHENIRIGNNPADKYGNRIERVSMARLGFLEHEQNSNSLWDEQTTKDHLTNAVFCLLYEYDNEFKQLRLRSEDELGRIQIIQTLNELILPDLLALTNIFINEGDRTLLTEEQIFNILDLEDEVNTIRANTASSPVPEIRQQEERVLRDFLLNACSLRFETIMDQAAPSIPPGSIREPHNIQ